jgi:hypothetical protein
LPAFTDDKGSARLNALTHILSKNPYEELKRAKVELPKRQHRGDCKDTDYPFRLIPEVFCLYVGTGFASYGIRPATKPTWKTLYPSLAVLRAPSAVWRSRKTSAPRALSPGLLNGLRRC